MCLHTPTLKGAFYGWKGLLSVATIYYEILLILVKLSISSNQIYNLNKVNFIKKKIKVYYYCLEPN